MQLRSWSSFRPGLQNILPHKNQVTGATCDDVDQTITSSSGKYAKICKGYHQVVCVVPSPVLCYGIMVQPCAPCTSRIFKNIRTRIGKRITNSLHPHPRQTYTSQPTTATAAAAATTVTTPTRLSLPPLSLPQFNRIQSDHPISSNPAPFSDSVIKC